MNFVEGGEALPAVIKDEPIDMSKLDTATFGAGCFWCVEVLFQKLKGVHHVENGYAAGVFGTWLIAIYLHDHGVVAALMGKLLLLPNWSTPILSACIGGLIAGFFGLSGALFSYRKKSWVNG